MLDAFKKTWFLFTRKEKTQAWGVVLLVVIMAQVETLGVALVMPFLAVLGNPSLVTQNQTLSALFDYFELNSVNEFLIFLGGGVCLVVVLSAIFRILTVYTINRYTHLRQHSISERLLETYLRQPYTYFLNRHTADMTKGVLSEVEQLINLVVKPVMDLVAYGVLVFTLVCFLIYHDPLIALIAGTVVGGAYVLVFLFVQKKLKYIGEERANANRERFTSAGEALGGIKDIKLLGCESHYMKRYSRASVLYASHQATNSTVSQVPKFLIEAIAFCGIISMAMVLMLRRDNFGEVLPVLGLYAFAGFKLLPGAQNIYASLAKLRFGAAVVENIYSDLSKRDSYSSIAGICKERLALESEVKLADITFTYPGAEKSSLTSLSIRIPKGGFIGLVGGTGAGKTTLVDIILGLLRPNEGALYIDGQVVNSKNLRLWQNLMGYVPQNIYLLDATVSENIALGVAKDEIDQSKVVRCAEMAQANDFIKSKLPEGYDTRVGERGVRLSGGQKQRIGIARALYHDPEILIFDEATSALDNVTEKTLMDAITPLMSEKTMIMIAHRLTTVRKCDRIFVMDHGFVVASGTYEELVSNSEIFREMTKTS